MNWKEYEFDIPLGVDLPDVPISKEADWWGDCEIDDIFGLKPCYYSTKNKYNAALILCRACGGWFYFETRDRNREIARDN